MSEKVDFTKGLEIYQIELGGSVHKAEVMEEPSLCVKVKDVTDGYEHDARKDGTLVGYKNWFIRNVCEKKLVPFTQETFPWPRQDVLVRDRCGVICSVVGTTENMVILPDHKQTWDEVLEYDEISLDRGVTWQAAGVLE